jgi:predicted molibdopterin-dependent oxidoreductase YjgC
MKSARQIEVEKKVAALERGSYIISDKIDAVRVAYFQKVLDAVMPLFTKYRVLEGDRILSGDGHYLYIKDSQKFEIVNIYGMVYDGKMSLRPSYYSTDEVSEFEFNRMITLGRVGEMFLNDKETLETVMDEVYRQRAEALADLYQEQRLLNADLGTLKSELGELEIRECLEVLQGGVSFVGLGRRPRLQVRFNSESFIDYLEFKDSKGTFSNVVIKYAMEDATESLRIKTEYLRDFTRSYKDIILR